MALYAAGNIARAVKNFEDRSYARVYGVILNRRNVEQEREKVEAFARQAGLPVVGEIPRSDEIIRCEDMGRTVIEGAPDAPVSHQFFQMARMLWESETSEGGETDLREAGGEIREKTTENGELV